jgi:hypothetical protein
VISLVPVQPSLALQLAALVLLQARVLLWPAIMVAGSAEMVSVGAGGAVTATMADRTIDPPAPLQVKV